MDISTHDAIYDITNIDDLLAALRNHQSWDQFPESVLKLIFDNAHGDVRKIQGFLRVSEQLDLVEDEFLPIVKDESDLAAVAASISAVLDEHASRTAQSISQLPDESDQVVDALDTAELAFRASMLCNPRMLTSYVGLARLYLIIANVGPASEVCQAYDVAERALLNAHDNDLTDLDLAIKSEAQGLREMISRIRAQLGIS